jgi:hypothetical protein
VFTDILDKNVLPPSPGQMSHSCKMLANIYKTAQHHIPEDIIFELIKWHDTSISSEY